MVDLAFETEHVFADDPTGGIVLDVEITLSDRPVRLKAHVDSGAANCLFQAEYAQCLGVNLREGVTKRFSVSDGGAIVAFGHEVNLTVLGHTVTSVVYFTEHEGFRRNVLGRQGWFHHFRIGLALYNSKIYLGRI